MSSIAELVGDVYEAAVAPERWPNFIAHLTDRVPDCFALIGVLDREPRFSLNLGLRGLADDAVQSYQQHFIRVNPWIGALLSAPVGRAVSVRPLVDDGAVQRGEFFQDWLRHQPGQHPTALMAPLDTGRRLCLTVVHGADGSPHEAAIEVLAPHFGRAAQLMKARERESRGAEDRAVLDMLSMGVIYADGGGRVIAANALAEAMLRDKEGIGCDRNGRLIALRPDDSEKLRSYVQEAALTSRGLPGSAGGTLRLPRPGDALPIAVLVAPLPTRDAGLALLLIKRPEDDRLDPLALVAMHDLTPSEAAVALMVVEGASLAQTAERRGVSLGTVQWQMKAILHKTGARNQADMVRRVLRTGLPLR